MEDKVHTHFLCTHFYNHEHFLIPEWTEVVLKFSKGWCHMFNLTHYAGKTWANACSESLVHIKCYCSTSEPPGPFQARIILNSYKELGLLKHANFNTSQYCNELQTLEVNVWLCPKCLSPIGFLVFQGASETTVCNFFLNIYWFLSGSR